MYALIFMLLNFHSLIGVSFKITSKGSVKLFTGKYIKQSDQFIDNAVLKHVTVLVFTVSKNTLGGQENKKF